MLTSRPNGSRSGAEKKREVRRGRGGGREGASWPALSLSSLPLLIILATVLLLGQFQSPHASDLSGYPWLYLRDDEPLTSSDGVVEVIAVGDVMLGRGVTDEPQPFGATASLLRRADVAVGNLECVLAPSSTPRTPGKIGSPAPLRADPSRAAHLRRAGFDVLGLANNHTFDLGASGLIDTVARLRAAGIAAAGVGPDAEAALEPVIRQVDGLRLAFLAFNGVPDEKNDGDWVRATWDVERAEAAVTAAHDGVDAVIVSIHWGYEYETRVDPAQRDAAQALLRAGADLVIGHHPHVVQTFEVSDGRCVAYSLGNFVFDQGQGETVEGLLLRAFFDEEGTRAIQALPVRAGPQPELMTVEEAQGLLDRVRRTATRRVFACSINGCRRVEPPTGEVRGKRSAVFWGGRVDLTGDGVPEHVRRREGRVIIYEEGVEAWRSPDPWRIVDLALGDPNDDGRSELMLALWKPGLDGLEPPSAWKERTPRSRPFIIGHRGGIYRTLWGGSAVSRSIHEVELGDVDGDRAEELIVLEALSKGSRERTISVWRWHGWGFSLMWRSQPGPYRDLIVGDGRTIEVTVE